MNTEMRTHYERLLAEHYDWMFGVPPERKVAEQKALLLELAGVAPGGDLAVDLGCGSGCQSLALAELGYRVLAIDANGQLLGLLAARSAGRGITARQGDILDVEAWTEPASARLVACMGDTLTHLSDRQDVVALVRSMARTLQPGGRFVVTWRDLSGPVPAGLDRFIPVHADDGRVMTCFLEDAGPGHVAVHDLIHVRDGAGRWTLHKGRYEKLRLPLDWLCAQLAEAGLAVLLARADRMATVVAQRPS